MFEGSVVRETIELLDSFLVKNAPFDAHMASFFKHRRYIGSEDRRNIANEAYAVLRNFQKINLVCRKITANHARFYMLTHLLINRGYSKAKIESLFCGKKYHPEKLSEFENKLLDKILNTEIEFPEYVKLEYPEWLENRLHKAFPVDFEEEMAKLNQAAPVDLRVPEEDIDQVIDELKRDGFDAEKGKISKLCVRINGKRISKSHKVVADGDAEIQDEGSQVIALECNPKSTDKVVDFCAGAGGKTLALSYLMQNKGQIYATDNNEKRLEQAKLRLRKRQVFNVHCHLISSKWIKRHADFADVVLVDAPCSGSGTWRRNPDMKLRISEEMISEVTEKQREILDKAKTLVKVGGKLVYATCSILCEENEEQVNWFLENNKNFEIEKPLTICQDDDYIKMSPHKTDTDGFFCVKFVKRS